MTDKTTSRPLEDDFRRRVCPSWTVTLYIGGEVDEVVRLLARQASEKGACWSVEPTEFVYSGGREKGVIVRQIAYARFPSDPDDAMHEMEALGEMLARVTGQGSFSVVGPSESVFMSRRKGD